MSSPVRRPPHIAVLVFEGVRGLDVAGPLEVFDVAGGLGSAYSVAFYSTTEATAVRCASGLTLHTAPVSALASEVIDILFVPGSESVVADGAPWHLVRTVRSHAARARRVASIGTGSFALAAAGVLDGRRATTHWRLLDSFAVRHPSVIVDRESVYICDGNVWTSAGAAAGIDLALALVCEDHGAAVAQDISKELVVLGRRLEGHPQISVAARTPRPKHPEIDRLLETVNVDPAGHYELDSVAAQLGISPRHLARLFKAQTGMTLRQYVHEVRMENAVALILAGESFRAAARRSGLHYGASVRTHLDARRTRLLADSRSAKAVSIHAG
ncbi:GlxA family transcriptional regulator [Mycolicibacterium iranicum]|uniref:AraC family transcriptional regulator n=1 Tax=Mycolicibacterium iranicum TaxID=912594 RepID=A0ABT4HH07_MYCIR|nr:AraC family transcriptional regulator [Mycolicibacterium iranicum]MCZ0729489.1 AraC family transcriptional regulator [Mycolicibacterium iranicum]